MAHYQTHECRITDGPQEDDGFDRYEDETDHDWLAKERRLDEDKDGVDDDAFELRRTLRDIGLSGDLPAFMKRQAGSE